MEENQNKGLSQIELLIDERIAKAKLEIAEKRLQFTITIAGAALALFGVLLPLFSNRGGGDKVDTAIGQMGKTKSMTLNALYEMTSNQHNHDYSAHFLKLRISRGDIQQ